VQREHAEQVLVGVEHVDVVDGLGLGGDLAEHHDGVVGADVGGDGDEGRGHPAAGGVRLVGEELADLRGLLGLHLAEDALGVLVAELGDDVGGVVGVHLLEQVGGLAGLEGLEDVGGLLRLELLEDAGDLGVRQVLQEGGDLRLVEALDEVGPVGRAQPVGEAADAAFLALGEELADLVDRLVRNHRQPWSMRPGTPARQPAEYTGPPVRC